MKLKIKKRSRFKTRSGIIISIIVLIAIDPLLNMMLATNNWWLIGGVIGALGIAAFFVIPKGKGKKWPGE